MAQHNYASDELLPLVTLAAMLPGHTRASTLARWNTDGVNGEHLRATKIAGRWYTTIDELNRFTAAISGKNTLPPIAAASRPPVPMPTPVPTQQRLFPTANGSALTPRVKPKLSKAQRAERRLQIACDCENGASLEDLVVKYNLSPHTIRRAVDEFSKQPLQRRQPPPSPPPPVPAALPKPVARTNKYRHVGLTAYMMLADLINTSDSCEVIAARHGVTASRVAQVVAAAQFVGIKLHPSRDELATAVPTAETEPVHAAAEAQPA